MWRWRIAIWVRLTRNSGTTTLCGAKIMEQSERGRVKRYIGPHQSEAKSRGGLVLDTHEGTSCDGLLSVWALFWSNNILTSVYFCFSTGDGLENAVVLAHIESNRLQNYIGTWGAWALVGWKGLKAPRAQKTLNQRCDCCALMYVTPGTEFTKMPRRRSEDLV
jgi:hypothetical protein